jgi:hypothetical protein
MLAAVPAAVLFFAPMAANAEWKEIGSRREIGQRASRHVYSDAYRGPPRYNMSRLHFQTPNYNPYPVYGYYGAQQYYSLWVPSFYYSFR